MGQCISSSGGARSPSAPRWQTEGPRRESGNTYVRRNSVPGLEPNSARRQSSAGNRAPRAALTPPGSPSSNASSSSSARTSSVQSAHSPRSSQSVYSHPSIGQFSVQAHPIAPGSNELCFDMALETPTGRRIETQHQMEHSQSDPCHGGHSSISFGDIEFPEEMQGKGLGTMYLAAAAKEAKKLGVELVGIDNVVSGAMRTLCNRVGMTQQFVPGFYELDPDTLLRNCERRAADKGWEAE